MRKWMLNIHLYGGLLCAPYLVIFGFSSIHFNHHFAFVDKQSDPAHWESALQVEASTNKDAMAESVRDSLGLMGWPLPWQTRRDASGDLEFALERPGKSYVIHTDLKQHRARVEVRRKSFFQVVNSLHALGAVPNSKFSSFWGVYTEICTAFVLFAAVSGVYLWLNSKRERRIGAVAFLAALLLSGALMFIVVKWG